ncbi:hypothetical protein CVU37_06635 [candidate division BRC1 bacterium HGW-BRC1-1]|jgi:SAM-dependent methyltransferase|nr:MAG: hypothetical protein CVU37_06635 [candidate division BRC1 bacterium HGW-BRC1-1]
MAGFGQPSVLTRFLPRRLPISRGARVLEIGSGGRPHPRATVLTDLHVGDASEREGRALITSGRSLIAADGERLPFRDGAFDYCVCSHVLEHAHDPVAMISEMQRVARAGYIETPSEMRDWLCAVPPYTTIHRWFVNLIDGELVLTPRTADTSTHRFAEALDLLRHGDPWFERWTEKSPHLFVIQYHWSGNIRARVADVSPFAAARTRDEVARLLADTRTRGPFFWGTGRWGAKRYLYAMLVHPWWRQLAKRWKKN